MENFCLSDRIGNLIQIMPSKLEISSQTHTLNFNEPDWYRVEMFKWQKNDPEDPRNI